MSELQLHRLGKLMEPQPGNPMEVEGVLNPAAIRGPDGQLYLLPRLVGRGNYSRIGLARVIFNKDGDPCGVERLGVVLEPEATYEKRPGGGGGCEDPRVTFVKPLGHYVMTYSAFSAKGPRIALAVSKDLFQWRRLGLVTFDAFEGIAFDGIDNKDATTFPVAVPDPSGKPALALIHRPLFPGTRPEEKAADANGVRDLHRESIWISYRDMDITGGSPSHLCHFTSHHRLASPLASWEHLKVGGGTPPILTRHGWLVLYHGVSEITDHDNVRRLRYSAGAMMLSEANPSVVLYRSPEPVLTPESSQERHGVTSNVVFPTGIDRRDDIGMRDRFDVYYGMADSRIGVARLDLPEHLPAPGFLLDATGSHPTQNGDTVAPGMAGSVIPVLINQGPRQLE
jgi:predicted GH43/DUF377 family glycosyl hydrolase